MDQIADEKFQFTAKIKKTLLIIAAIGVALTVLGFALPSGGHGDGHGGGHGGSATEQAESHNGSSGEHNDNNEGHGGSHNGGHEASSDHDGGHGDDHHGGSATWLKRLYANLWFNNLYFLGIALIGVVFAAIQYASQAGWSAGLKRIPEMFGHWIPFGGVILIVVFAFGHYDLFHWTHTYLYEKGTAAFDEILFAKRGYFFWPQMEDPSVPVFYILRMVVFLVAWYIFFKVYKKFSLKEDVEGGTKWYYKLRKTSTLFLIFFAFTSAAAGWDWVMSIDPHWFSTMFGWYVFASWFVSGLCAITLVVVLLRENGYLTLINSEHLHDLGKFVFGFSIFWTYIWFAQFMLIYYANIPEESIYFVERMTVSPYSWIFYANIILNFFFPFLVLMTRDSKRHTVFLKIITIMVLVGHWFDFYLMVMPGVMKQEGVVGFVEIGITMVFGAAFVWVLLNSMSKAPLVAKNHPMLEESMHHHT